MSQAECVRRVEQATDEQIRYKSGQWGTASALGAYCWANNNCCARVLSAWYLRYPVGFTARKVRVGSVRKQICAPGPNNGLCLLQSARNALHHLCGNRNVNVEALQYYITVCPSAATVRDSVGRQRVWLRLRLRFSIVSSGMAATEWRDSFAHLRKQNASLQGV